MVNVGDTYVVILGKGNVSLTDDHNITPVDMEVYAVMRAFKLHWHTPPFSSFLLYHARELVTNLGA